MTHAETIHTAFAVSTKGGKHYRARAFILRESRVGPIKHTRTISLDDTSEAAIEACLQDIRRRCAADGVPMPSEIVHHGRKAAVVVDHHQFDIGSAR